MVWYAAKYNQIEPARGNSGTSSFCVPTLAGSFIGDSTMKNRSKRYKHIRVGGKVVCEQRYLMEQHIGRPLQLNEHIHHIDNDKKNNDISNLQILPQKIHNQLSGRTTLTGAKLKPSDIPVIRQMLRDNIKQFVIAFAYGVNHASISDIKTKRSWGWLPPPEKETSE